MRNLDDIPWNHSCHHGDVDCKSVRQMYFPLPVGEGRSREGTEASALAGSRIVRVRMCHWIASSREEKMLGREER